ATRAPPRPATSYLRASHAVVPSPPGAAVASPPAPGCGSHSGAAPVAHTRWPHLADGCAPRSPPQLAAGTERSHPPRTLYPAPRAPAPAVHGPGGLPEWSKGAVCKTVGSAYVGSNPTPATTSNTALDQLVWSEVRSCCIRSGRV